MKKIFRTFLILLISHAILWPPPYVYATVSPQIGDMLCEKGIFYFDRDQYPQALFEFRKALLANPESGVAREYIRMIEGELLGAPGAGQGDVRSVSAAQKDALVDSYLSGLEARVASTSVPSAPYLSGGALSSMDESGRLSAASAEAPDRGEIRPGPAESGAQAAQDNMARPSASKAQGDGSRVVSIDLSVYEFDQIVMFVDEPLWLKGYGIRRFLVTHPAILTATLEPAGELLLVPRDIGNSYLHVWNAADERKSYKIVVGPKRFEEVFAQATREKIRQEGIPESFKFTYSISGDSYLTGRGIGDLEQQSYTMAYSSSLIGETPYGKFDASVLGNRTTLDTYRISNLRMGLTGAHYDQFKDINIRWFDYGPTFSAFGFPVSELRGIKVDAPMFKKALNYSAFWGAIPEGDFTFLSPDSGLSKTKKAWLEGVGLSFRPVRFANFKSYYVHSYGPDRIEPVLTSDAAGFEMDYDFGALNFGAGVSTDMTNFAYTADTSLIISKLRVAVNYADNAKNFASLLGGIPTSGSVGGTVSINYRPTNDLNIYNAFSAIRDRSFFNPDDPERPNYNSTTRINWVPDLHTEIEAGYIMDDRIGSNTPSVTETKEIIFRKKLFFIRRFGAYLQYQNRKSKNYTSPAQDFNNNRIMGGLNLRVLGDLYFFYNREFNLLRNTFTNETAAPMAQEFGLNFNRQVFDTPFYTNLRLYYRDEQNTASVLSFLSGEDRLEGEAELIYKPSAGNEVFVKTRITNTWAEKSGVAKHLDLNINWGVRLLWDTGLRWQSVGGFCGFVFYDTNGDGVKQAGEAGVPGVRVIANGTTDALTDQDGYYRFNGIEGKVATLTLDLATVPQGYNPTVSAEQEVDIVHGRAKRHDFGLATRMEISGLVFYDKNKNGVYDAQEETIKGVVLVLDADKRAATNLQGTYYFRKFAPGERTITLDLKTLPVKYLPRVPIRKTVTMREGTSYVYNVPLELQEEGVAPSLEGDSASREVKTRDISVTATVIL